MSCTTRRKQDNDVPILVRTLGLVPAVLATALCLGCSMTRPYDPLPDDEESMTLDEATVSVYRALCRYWERCDPEKLSYFPAGDVNACLSFYACHTVAPDESISRGGPARKIPVFADAAACREHVETSPCDSSLSSVTPNVTNFGLGNNSYVTSFPLHWVVGGACASVEENPGRGEPCLLDYAGCADGLFCQVGEPARLAGDRFCGRCSERLPPGSLCDETTACAAGSFCSSGLCEASGDPGVPCESPEQCVSGICLDGTCREMGMEGDVCDMGFTCASSICLEGRCATRSGAVQVFEADVGDPCGWIFNCRLGLACAEGTCQRSACVAEQGAPCSFEYPRGCEAGSACDMGDGVCVALRAEGEACSQSTCEPGLECRSQGKDGWRCIKLLPDGAACGEHADCASDYCHRDEFSDDTCRVASHWKTACDVSSCTSCGVCRPEPTTAQCVDTS